MDPCELIEKFYTAFQNGDEQGMTDCYHENIVFQDLAFGRLEGNKAKKMWEMLLSRKVETTKISFQNIQTTDNSGSADWRAEYLFGKKKRKVINTIHAEFKFQDGKIIEHIDSFNLWRWSRQALGPIGLLLGWSAFLRNKVQKSTNAQLASFIAKKLA